LQAGNKKEVIQTSGKIKESFFISVNRPAR
jgi:hypothetical protein